MFSTLLLFLASGIRLQGKDYLNALRKLGIQFHLKVLVFSRVLLKQKGLQINRKPDLIATSGIEPPKNS